MSLFSKSVHPEKLAAGYLEQGNQHEPQLDKNLWAERVKRDQEAASIPEWEEFRELASEIKKHTLTHLDEYLLQFEENATKRGAIVHWARDAKEHNAILLEILRSHEVKEVIKSKSMLQKECEPIPFLKKPGFTVTKPALGERIQQLDDEQPSHI